MSGREGFDAGLIAYFQQRDRDRAAQVDAVLAVMTKRERALVREVAVMANVLAGDWKEKPPPDSVVLGHVISLCLGQPDLFPTIARLARTAVRRAQRAANPPPRP